MSYTPTDADFDALVVGALARGIAPLDVALLELEESGFLPSKVNAGSGDSGLNQMDDPNLKSLGLTRAVWVAMSAAAQQPVIYRFWDSLVKDFAGGVWPTSAAELLALNFLPGRYAKVDAASNHDAALTERPEKFYTDNAIMDPGKTGRISVDTIALYLAGVPRANPSRWAMLQAGVAAALARAGGSPPSSEGA